MKNPELNCEDFTIDRTTGELTCTECPVDHITSTKAEVLKVTFCEKLNLIEKCIDYDNENDITKSDYFCKECDKDYFL